MYSLLNLWALSSTLIADSLSLISLCLLGLPIYLGAAMHLLIKKNIAVFPAPVNKTLPLYVLGALGLAVYVLAMASASFSLPVMLALAFVLAVLEADEAYNSPLSEGGSLAVFDWASTLPITWWSASAQHARKSSLTLLWAKGSMLYLSYQDLWFNRRHRKIRRKIRHFFERPLRLRRYWYLCLKSFARFACAWFGIPFRQHPGFRLGNTWGGFLIKRLSTLLSSLISYLSATAIWSYGAVYGRMLSAELKRLWIRRPSIIEMFVKTFQPEAPIYRRRGYTITPSSRRPRFVNLFSDMEVFASQGGSLLVFMFLIWSFFARILLVICLLSVF